MKGLSITGLVLGAAGPLVLLAPLIAAAVAGGDFWNVGWVFLLLTVPTGLALEIAGSVLVIIASSLALRRGYRPRSLPIVAISLIGAGLIVQVLGGIAFSGPGRDWSAWVFLAGLAITLTGVIMGSVVGIRGRYRRVRRR